MWLIIVAEEPVIKPLANIIGYYSCYNRFYERMLNTSSLLSVAYLPEWNGDNIVTVAQILSTLQ